MEFIGEERIEAPRDVVWTALNDPEILKGCIPGCETLEWISDTELAATIRVKVGVLSFRFSGGIRLSDVRPGESYTLHAEGKGGVAGFGRGTAKVTLADDGDETILAYASKAEVEGKIAQLAAKLIDSGSARLAARFFGAFNAAVSGKAAAEKS